MSSSQPLRLYKQAHRIQEITMTSTLRVEQRCVIKFCGDAKMTPTETPKIMNREAGNVSRGLVLDWHKKFRDSLKDVTDKPRIARPEYSEADIERVHNAVNENRRRPVRELSNMAVLCVNVLNTILTENLKMNKVCARGCGGCTMMMEKQSGSGRHVHFLRVMSKKVSASLTAS